MQQNDSGISNTTNVAHVGLLSAVNIVWDINISDKMICEWVSYIMQAFLYLYDGQFVSNLLNTWIIYIYRHFRVTIFEVNSYGDIILSERNNWYHLAWE